MQMRRNCDHESWLLLPTLSHNQVLTNHRSLIIGYRSLEAFLFLCISNFHRDQQCWLTPGAKKNINLQKVSLPSHRLLLSGNPDPAKAVCLTNAKWRGPSPKISWYSVFYLIDMEQITPALSWTPTASTGLNWNCRQQRKPSTLGLIMPHPRVGMGFFILPPLCSPDAEHPMGAS
jgi:hypothetical protein